VYVYRYMVFTRIVNHKLSLRTSLRYSFIIIYIDVYKMCCSGFMKANEFDFQIAFFV
jgi:hypothetical protein